ncbi:MAG: hypothetical protein ACI9HK_002979 [Pirellulaceae bacterium]|jgi:uncharacterized protein (DUF58 family)
MITSRFRWLRLLGIAGTAFGVLRGQDILAISSLAVLLWLFADWVMFRMKVLVVVRALECERWINDSAKNSGTLWSLRTANIRVRVNSPFPVGLRIVRAEDYLPEILELDESSNSCDGTVGGGKAIEFTYRVKPCTSGIAKLPGVCIQLFDVHGFFFFRHFIACEQVFRVLPMPVRTNTPASRIKFSNNLTTLGIHREQKSGMGAELHELREYVAGDPPKSIAWKVSARRDALIVRQNENEVPIRTTLFVDCSQNAQRGQFGNRPIDRNIFLAATIAQSSLAIRDPVGLVLFDEQQTIKSRPAGGQRHYYRLLDQLSQGAAFPVCPPARLSDELLQQAWNVASALYPSHLNDVINLVPFSIFPMFPASRYRRRQRQQLATLFCELYELPADGPTRLQQDNPVMAKYAQQFLLDAGCAPSYSVFGSSESHQKKMDILTTELVNSVTRGRDNEIFVLLVDLLDHREGLEQLTRTIRVATARHHRVMVICPRPSRPSQTHQDALNTLDGSNVEDLVLRGELIRLAAAEQTIKHEIRKCGASIAFADDPKATALVLAQAELIRTGRTAGA